MLETHYCTAEELGLANGKSEFMPVSESSKVIVELYQKKFMCLKKEDAYIYGNYNSSTARLI